jgi:hypothetical protein
VRYRSAMIVVVLASLAGCGKHTVPTVPVTGRITYAGGQWPKPGILYFTPSEAFDDLPCRPGTASFGADGKFRATAFANRDGLIPGSYRLHVECWEYPPSMDPKAPAAKSYIPSTFQATSQNGFEVRVDPDKDGVELDLDVPKT